MNAVAWVLVMVFSGAGGQSTLVVPFADRASCEAARAHVVKSLDVGPLAVRSQGCYSTRAPA